MVDFGSLAWRVGDVGVSGLGSGILGLGFGVQGRLEFRAFRVLGHSRPPNPRCEMLKPGSPQPESLDLNVL